MITLSRVYRQSQIDSLTVRLLILHYSHSQVRLYNVQGTSSAQTSILYFISLVRAGVCHSRQIQWAYDIKVQKFGHPIMFKEPHFSFCCKLLMINSFES